MLTSFDQMMLSLREHPFSASLVNGELKGKAEQSFFCTDSETGLELKARPDFILDDCSLILDLKTTVDASPRAFSAALPISLLRAGIALPGRDEGATGTRPQAFLFVAVEKLDLFDGRLHGRPGNDRSWQAACSRRSEQHCAVDRRRQVSWLFRAGGGDLLA